MLLKLHIIWCLSRRGVRSLGSLETGQGDAEDGHGAEGKLEVEQLLTDPDQAIDFVNKTKVDALAIAMGTSHGAYKFPESQMEIF